MDSNINNVTVHVPLFASVTIKWLFGKPGIQRIVLGISSASQVIGRFQNGEFGCYKDGLLTEMECHRHFSLTVNASSEIIIAITNISDSFFGNYIVSIYRGPDDKIDTLWIIVNKKESLLQDMSSTAWTPTVSLPHMSHTHTEGHVITNTNKYSEQPPKSKGTVKTNISLPSKFIACRNTYFGFRSFIENGLHCYCDVLSKCNPHLS